MSEKAYVYLKFIDEKLDPSGISSLIGIEPTIAGRKGDLIPGRKLPIKEGVWMYRHMMDEIPWDVGDAISSLLQLIEPNTALRQFCSDNDIYLEFSVVLYLAINTPIITLEPFLLKRVAAINATIDFDIYLIPH